VLYLNNPAREGLALYKDGTMEVYDETELSADELLANGVWNTYSFGPALLVDGAIPVGLDETEVEDVGEEHTILGSQPRTGVGIVDKNHFVFIVVDGRSTGYSMGVALSEFAQIFKDLGCTTAYNLDGGGSSTMYFMGELVNNPLGQGKERGISDILFVG
jgi:exopolysaccharide biosynthesis protein